MHMENSTSSKYTNSFGVALAVTSVVNALLVAVKEKSPAVQAAMKSLTGHHWITHGLVDVAVFVVTGAVLMRLGVRFDGRRMLIAVIAAALLGGGGLTLWFLLF